VADLFRVRIEETDAVLELHERPSARRMRPYFVEWLADEAKRLSVSLSQVRLVESLCFLSLASLHSERPDRQMAFLVRGLQIAGEMLDGG
jgi:hypothetical protein